METNESMSQETGAPPARIGFGKRLGAYLLDMVAAGIGGGVIGIFAGASLAAIIMGSGEMGSEMEGAEMAGGALAGMMAGMAGTIAGMLLIFLIIMLLEAFTGQTIGKMILGIKNGNEDGSAASTGTLLTRALIKYIATVMTVLAGITGVAMLGSIGNLLGFIVFIGFFFVLGDKKQGFHDLIAKTAVFNKSDIK